MRRRLPKPHPEYKEGAHAIISQRAEEKYGVKPLRFQLKATTAILQGKDVILDVGTGSGKTLCFTLPLLLNETDVVLVVSPLTALMMEQAEKSPISSIAICQETLESQKEQIFSDAASGKIRYILVSPEMASSPEFAKAVLSVPTFYNALRMLVIDEAHCVNEWGGSFRPDYEDLGVLRGRIPRHVPMMIASATLPPHVKGPVCDALQLAQDAATVSVENGRPNVALSRHVMDHSEESKADLRRAIPEHARSKEDIPIQLIYVNRRKHCEVIADRLRDWLPNGISRDCIAFYHARIGSARKRELEQKLRDGEVRILVCTDAVGMGCDLRNIDRVILWELPPTFCSLVQRAGRAARDMSKLGEALLFIQPSIRKEGVKADDVVAVLDKAIGEAESQNNEDWRGNEPLGDGVELSRANEHLEVREGGVRVGRDEDDDVVRERSRHVTVMGTSNKITASKQKRSKPTSAVSTHESTFLHRFANSTTCLRKIWDDFFENHRKEKLEYGVNTLYKPIAGARCCCNCEPDRFELPEVQISDGNTVSIKRGRRRFMDPRLQELIRTRVREWRDGPLFDKLYPDSMSMTPEYIMSDTVIDKLATCGHEIHTEAELRSYVRWSQGFDEQLVDSTWSLSDHGRELLHILSKVYGEYADECRRQKEEEDRIMRSVSTPIPPDEFYANPHPTRSGRRKRTL